MTTEQTPGAFVHVDRYRPVAGFRLSSHSSVTEAMDPEQSGVWFPPTEERAIAVTLADLLAAGRVVAIETYRAEYRFVMFGQWSGGGRPGAR